MNKKTKLFSKIVAMLLTLALLGEPMATMAYAVEINDGPPSITMYDTVIGFAGHEWIVLGNESSGIYSQPNSVTLLLKKDDAGNGFGNLAFRAGSDTQTDPNWTLYSDGFYYEGSFTSPTDYNDSTLLRKMEDIANRFDSREQVLINERTLTSSDNIGGAMVNEQKLWALSKDEVHPLILASEGQSAMQYDNIWWLRSAVDDSTSYCVSITGRFYANTLVYSQSPTIRPAFSLNLSSVLFSSTASGAAGKSAATVGSGLVAASVPTGAVKLTVKDSNLSLSSVTPLSVSGRTITFDYTGATMGKTLSAIVQDDDGNVKYYGQLAGVITTADSASVTVPDDFTAIDSLHIFVEEINGDYYTDYACTPIPLIITQAIAPKGLASVACTTLANNDGKITGTTVAMEYSADNGSTWVSCGGSEVTGLMPDTYQVRNAGKADDNGIAILASSVILITVEDCGDTTSPNLSSVSPTNNATDIDINGDIIIKFNEPMNMTAGTVSLNNSSGTLTDGSWSADKQTYTIGYSGLDWETDYTITVEDFEDAAGNVMDPNPVESDFTTMAQPTGPYVTPTSLTITTGDTGTFEVYLGESGNEAARADITSSDTSIATVDTFDVFLVDSEEEAAIATSSNASITSVDTFDVYLEDDEDEAAIATGSNASIALMDASVTTSGQTITVTGISLGTATITIRFSGGSYSGGSQTVSITVQDPPDTLSPTVANITPGGTGVSRSGNLAITFSEKMDSATGTVSLNGVALTGTGTWTNSGMTYTIPYSGLLYNTTYTITISGFKDAAGNVMTADGSHSFTTISSSGGSSSGSSSGSSTASGNSKWIQDGVGWKYKKADGTYTVDGWQQIFWNGRTDWYFFGADGYMKTGWMFWKNDWFYLHPVSDGTLGHMHSGWTMVDGVWYYMYTANDKGVEGAMLVNTVTPDGYQVNANGAWIP